MKQSTVEQKIIHLADYGAPDTYCHAVLNEAAAGKLWIAIQWHTVTCRSCLLGLRRVLEHQIHKLRPDADPGAAPL